MTILIDDAKVIVPRSILKLVQNLCNEHSTQYKVYFQQKEFDEFRFFRSCGHKVY